MVDSLMSPRYHSETSITKLRVDSKSCLLVQKGKGILKGSPVNISNLSKFLIIPDSPHRSRCIIRLHDQYSK